MKNEIIRRIDNQNRLQLPSMLMEFVNFTDEKILAICPGEEETMIKLRKIINTKNCKIIGFVKVDDRGRIVIPPEIRQETQYFEVFVFNGELIIKEALE